MIKKQFAVIGMAAVLSQPVIAQEETQQGTSSEAKPGTGGEMRRPWQTQRPIITSNAFNPAVSLILYGTYSRFTKSYQEDIHGFAPAGDAHGATREGLSLQGSELVLSSNVDNKFYGSLILKLEDGKAQVEEAFFQTLGLPQGLTVKGGRFLSGIGYLNEQHPHFWDFVDIALPYRAMLGGNYGDDGVQLRWVAPTPLFVEFGAEALRGENFPASGAAKRGIGARSAFVNLGDDVGLSHSWRAGVARLEADAQGRMFEDHAHNEYSFTGKAPLNVANFVWKWAPLRNPAVTNFKFQAEYLQRDESGAYTFGSPVQDVRYGAKQSGWYAQAVYQFMPRWRVGARYDALKGAMPPVELAGTILDPEGHKPQRASVMLDFSNSAFSRLRVQFSHNQTAPKDANEIYLQYIMSLGAHGAHKF